MRAPVHDDVRLEPRDLKAETHMACMQRSARIVNVLIRRSLRDRARDFVHSLFCC
jgi:hypothetical protein